MKSDRELLELAAKAAGHKLGEDWSCLPEGIFINGDDRFSGDEWNPLTDDGDALRLAVKLNLLYGKVFTRGVSDNHEDGDDIYAATRRAIVRAAAKIGEAMQ